MIKHYFSAISAVAGGVDLDIVEFEEQRKNIEKIIPHEDFNFDNLRVEHHKVHLLQCVLL